MEELKEFSWFSVNKKEVITLRSSHDSFLMCSCYLKFTDLTRCLLLTDQIHRVLLHFLPNFLMLTKDYSWFSWEGNGEIECRKTLSKDNYYMILSARFSQGFYGFLLAGLKIGSLGRQKIRKSINLEQFKGILEQTTNK